MLLGLLVGLMVCPDKAESAQASVSYLHGDGYASGGTTRNVVRLDALAVKDWGMGYGRVGATSFDDGNSNVFTRAIAHGGRGLHIAGQLQNQYRVSQSSAGLGYSDFGKESNWFVDFYKLSSNYYGDSGHAKNGIRGLDESINQLMVKWEF